MNTPANLFSIRQATLEARKRTGDKTIAVRSKGGEHQIVRVTYTTANSTVAPVSGWLSAAQAEKSLASVK